MNARARAILLSHAPTAAIRHAAFPRDESIEDGAREKLRAVGWHAAGAQQVLSAPEKRARETAAALGLSPVVDPMLRDYDYGSWAGHTLDDLQREHPDEVALWLSVPDAAPHGGESLRHLIARGAEWLSGQTNSGYTIAITHAAVIRGILISVLKAPEQSFWRIDVAPLSLTDLRFNGSAWTLRSTGASLRKETAG